MHTNTNKHKIYTSKRVRSFCRSIRDNGTSIQARAGQKQFYTIGQVARTFDQKEEAATSHGGGHLALEENS